MKRSKYTIMKYNRLYSKITVSLSPVSILFARWRIISVWLMASLRSLSLLWIRSLILLWKLIRHSSLKGRKFRNWIQLIGICRSWGICAISPMYSSRTWLSINQFTTARLATVLLRDLASSINRLRFMRSALKRWRILNRSLSLSQSTNNPNTKSKRYDQSWGHVKFSSQSRNLLQKLSDPSQRIWLSYLMSRIKCLLWGATSIHGRNAWC